MSNPICDYLWTAIECICILQLLLYIVVLIVTGGVRHSTHMIHRMWCQELSINMLDYIVNNIVLLLYKQMYHLFFCCISDRAVTKCVFGALIGRYMCDFKQNFGLKW